MTRSLVILVARASGFPPKGDVVLSKPEPRLDSRGFKVYRRWPHPPTIQFTLTGIQTRSTLDENFTPYEVDYVPREVERAAECQNATKVRDIVVILILHLLIVQFRSPCRV